MRAMQPPKRSGSRERSIPEATVGRLPVYLRGLVDIAESGAVTVSLPVVEQVSLLAGGSRGLDRTPPTVFRRLR